MKKLLFVISLFAILFTQCKKSEQIVPVTPESKTVNITLNVSGNSKVDVWTQHGAVAFESGDVIYVASAGKYVGTLTHNGTKFEGSITGAVEDQKLYFYFMGNKTPSEALNESTTSLTVNISDQTVEYPVISSAPSAQNFSSETSDYSAFLLNKCALVKFDVTTLSTSNTCIKKMNNSVSVNLSSNVYTNSKVDGGVIKMTAGNGERWAILLPQDEITGDTEGDDFSADGFCTGSYWTVPLIGNNSYVPDGISITLNGEHEYVDLGLPSGLLWATCNIGANSPEDYGDYFAWGETSTKSIYGWHNYQWCNGSETTLTKYNTIPSCGVVDNKNTLEPEDDAAHVNWGGIWRMPTTTEIYELETKCTWTWVLLSRENKFGYIITSLNCNSIILPTAGYYWNNIESDGYDGYYWSNMIYTTTPTESHYLFFNSHDPQIYHYKPRCYGQPIRPVATSLSMPPSVTTHVVSNITQTSAVCGGNVTSDGGASVTSRGVCWSTTTNPTISDNHTTDGTGTGSFTSSLSGLSSNTTYHVRAYATNNKGTSYGIDREFKTTKDWMVSYLEKVTF